jgi:hypothetical protein
MKAQQCKGQIFYGKRWRRCLRKTTQSYCINHLPKKSFTIFDVEKMTEEERADVPIRSPQPGRHTTLKQLIFKQEYRLKTEAFAKESLEKSHVAQVEIVDMPTERFSIKTYLKNNIRWVGFWSLLLAAYIVILLNISKWWAFGYGIILLAAMLIYDAEEFFGAEK